MNFSLSLTSSAPGDQLGEGRLVAGSDRIGFRSSFKLASRNQYLEYWFEACQSLIDGAEVSYFPTSMLMADDSIILHGFVAEPCLSGIKIQIFKFGIQGEVDLPKLRLMEDHVGGFFEADWRDCQDDFEIACWTVSIDDILAFQKQLKGDLNE